MSGSPSHRRQNDAHRSRRKAVTREYLVADATVRFEAIWLATLNVDRCRLLALTRFDRVAAA